jgi:hypothetical protein
MTYLFTQYRRITLSGGQQALMAASFAGAAALSLYTWLAGMRTGVRALQEMDKTPS